eukprot:m.122790 g.122790  ORF g.122790 m.122790 type:complete len:562 (+) comp28942_c0_seq2:307-1992(+)
MSVDPSASTLNGSTAVQTTARAKTQLQQFAEKLHPLLVDEHSVIDAACVAMLRNGDWDVQAEMPCKPDTATKRSSHSHDGPFGLKLVEETEIIVGKGKGRLDKSRASPQLRGDTGVRSSWDNVEMEEPWSWSDSNVDTNGDASGSDDEESARALGSSDTIPRLRPLDLRLYGHHPLSDPIELISCRRCQRHYNIWALPEHWINCKVGRTKIKKPKAQPAKRTKASSHQAHNAVAHDAHKAKANPRVTTSNTLVEIATTNTKAERVTGRGRGRGRKGLLSQLTSGDEVAITSSPLGWRDRAKLRTFEQDDADEEREHTRGSAGGRGSGRRRSQEAAVEVGSVAGGRIDVDDGVTSPRSPSAWSSASSVSSSDVLLSSNKRARSSSPTIMTTTTTTKMTKTSRKKSRGSGGATGARGIGRGRGRIGRPPKNAPKSPPPLPTPPPTKSKEAPPSKTLTSTAKAPSKKYYTPKTKTKYKVGKTTIATAATTTPATKYRAKSTSGTVLTLTIPKTTPPSGHAPASPDGRAYKRRCPTPGCDGFGHRTGKFSFHHTPSGCPALAIFD